LANKQERTTVRVLGTIEQYFSIVAEYANLPNLVYKLVQQLLLEPVNLCVWLVPGGYK